LLVTQRYLLAAVLVYQLLLLHRFEAGAAARAGLNAFTRLPAAGPTVSAP